MKEHLNSVMNKYILFVSVKQIAGAENAVPYPGVGSMSTSGKHGKSPE